MNNILLYHKLILLNEILDKKCKSKPNSFNISRGQGRILIILKQKDGLSTKDLSNIIGISVSSLNESLNKLEENKLIYKQPSKKDKRILLIKLTEKGKKYKILNNINIKIFDCLTDNEKENFNIYLDKILFKLHEDLKKENPEKFKKIHNKRQELFKKHFNTHETNQWFKIIKE